MTNKEQILGKAVELLKRTPHGIRYSDLVRRVQEALPKIPVNTIHGYLWRLEVLLPNEAYKPARGMYLHMHFREGQRPEVAEPPSSPVGKVKEEKFYESFADWLVKELEECTKAIPVGGNRFKDKWGTPDVIGIREPRKSDIIRFPTEIVSAEVKVDSANLITAFGQACAYRLFSHKSYIVIPGDSPEEDTARLDTLCRIFGIGLILFDSNEPRAPRFEIRVRATKHEPDMFYVNRCMKLVEDELFS
ncbi:MAG: hypothetical protein HYY65_15040 [Candidatus Tectomicrobia bacterium]|uniref:Uncharacterized protein n=1 Tax=Tectimicrobiota bacterium TaxID=2528274 RepID=A0A932GSR2_UNCTE|nr:hypothetical protein [Candidatus Tectomicrobia bacterium]